MTSRVSRFILSSADVTIPRHETTLELTGRLAVVEGTAQMRRQGTVALIGIPGEISSIADGHKENEFDFHEPAGDLASAQQAYVRYLLDFGFVEPRATGVGVATTNQTYQVSGSFVESKGRVEAEGILYGLGKVQVNQPAGTLVVSPTAYQLNKIEVVQPPGRVSSTGTIFSYQTFRIDQPPGVVDSTAKGYFPMVIDFTGRAGQIGGTFGIRRDRDIVLYEPSGNLGVDSWVTQYRRTTIGLDEPSGVLSVLPSRKRTISIGLQESVGELTNVRVGLSGRSVAIVGALWYRLFMRNLGRGAN